jgi:hypothetical protein
MAKTTSDDPFWGYVTDAVGALEEREDMSIDAGPWTAQGAVFDDDYTYRYRLFREWDPTKPTCTFVMLNPSVANAVKLDPTVRRCIKFAKRWGCGRLEVVNVFALVSTDPKGLELAEDPVGPENDRYILESCNMAAASKGAIVAAWSFWATLLKHRDETVLRFLGEHKIWTLGFTKDGDPRHPLYMPKDAPLRPWLWRTP